MSEQQDEQHRPPVPQYGPPPPGTPYSQTPFGTPLPPAPASPPRQGGLPTGAIIGIVAGAVGLVLVLMVALGFGALNALRPALAPPDRDPAPTPAPDAAGAALAVEGYLHALADGDAEAALEYLWVEEGQGLLLTDEVLAVSSRLAPITSIEVGTGSAGFEDYGVSVPVSFKLGDQRVEREFELWEASDGWEIFDGLVPVWFDGLTGLDPTVNGVAAEGYLPVFPGVYEVVIDNDYLALDLPEGRVRLATDDDSYDLTAVPVVPTELGDTTFRSLVRASLDECLAMTSLTTPCGFDVSATTTGSAGDRIVEGSVRRELTQAGRDAFDALTIEQDYDPPTAMTTWDYFPVRATAQLANGGTAEVQASPMRYPQVDFAAAQPRVEWVD